MLVGFCHVDLRKSCSKGRDKTREEEKGKEKEYYSEKGEVFTPGALNPEAPTFVPMEMDAGGYAPAQALGKGPGPAARGSCLEK